MPTFIFNWEELELLKEGVYGLLPPLRLEYESDRTKQIKALLSFLDDPYIKSRP